MAAEDEGRTEEPSEYRIRKAREEGRVPKSQELSGALVLLMCVVALVFLSRWLFNNLTTILYFYFNKAVEHNLGDPTLKSFFLEYFIKSFLPISLIALVAGIMGNIVQTRGFVFSLKPIEPKPQNIVPHLGQYFKKTIFSLKGVFNIGKSFFKVGIIIFVGYLYIRKDIFVLIEIISNGDIAGGVSRIGRMGAQILITVAVIFLILSIPDYFIQRHEFMEEQKMTKQQVKEEWKEMEGDPEVKARLQQMQRDLLQQNLPKAVSESDVVVANPTHYAVALKYSPGEDVAPVVNAKGQDEMAFRIRHLAEENNIPIIENKPVARDLYTNTEVGGIIPDIYIRTIVEIYSQLDKFKQK